MLGIIRFDRRTNSRSYSYLRRQGTLQGHCIGHLQQARRRQQGLFSVQWTTRRRELVFTPLLPSLPPSQRHPTKARMFSAMIVLLPSAKKPTRDSAMPCQIVRCRPDDKPRKTLSLAVAAFRVSTSGCAVRAGCRGLETLHLATCTACSGAGVDVAMCMSSLAIKLPETCYWVGQALAASVKLIPSSLRMEHGLLHYRPQQS